MAPVKSSERTLPITALAKPYFERHLDLQNEQRRLVRSSGSSYYDNDLVFSKSDGSPKRKERISSNFGQLLRRAGLPHRWRLPILGLPQRRNAANLFYEGSSNMLYFDVICYLPILWCRAPFGHHKNLCMKKGFSLIISLAIMLSLTGNAFAAENSGTSNSLSELDAALIAGVNAGR